MMKLVLLAAIVSVAFAIEKRQVAKNAPPVIKILSQESDLNPDGTYKWAFDTENGITAQEQGQPGGTGEDAGTIAQGSYSYTSPEGVPVRINYIADLEGFRAEGDSIPQPPEIPAPIAKALQYNSAHPEQETSSERAESLPSAPSKPSQYSPIGSYSLG